jgi:geranylgeranyl diphosphate synthase type II
MMDILSEGTKVQKKTLEFIQLNKTAKLIQLCTRWGAFLADASKSDIANLDEFGQKLGLAFQIVDDILDVEGTSASMGKTVGKDQKVEKATYPAVFGLEKSKEKADKLTKEALKLLESYGDNALYLIELTKLLLNRKN